MGYARFLLGLILLGIRPVLAQAPGAAREAVTLKTARALALGWSRADSLWPGVFGAGLRIGIYPYAGSGMLLVGVDSTIGTPLAPSSCPAECAPLGLRTVPRGYPYPDFYPSYSLAPEAPYGLAVAATLAPPSPESGIADTVRSTLAMVLHERFHVFQQSPGSFRAVSRATLHRGPVNPYIAGGAAEGRLEQLARERMELVRALDAMHAGGSGHRSHVRAALRRYYALRALRLRSEDEALAEAGLERMEGLAQFVGVAMTHAVLGFSRDSTYAELRRNLLRPSHRIGGGLWADPVYRGWHVYAAGAAKAFLLSRLRSDWREALRSGCSLDAPLAREPCR